MSTGASVMLRAVLTFAGRTTTYSFMATPAVFACEAVDADDVAVLVFTVGWPSDG